jgi:NADH dehydrogenase
MAATSTLQSHRNRLARGGTLILGGGFGGAYVARLLGERGATIVSPDSSMLYTPLLPEVAAGAIEPRHCVVPLRLMCPHAEVVPGRAVALDEQRRTVTVEGQLGTTEIRYERLVVALGAVTRLAPIDGLGEHALGLKTIGDAIRLRNHVLHQLDLAEGDRENAARHLTFVFVGAGYAGVEGLAEVAELVDAAMRGYPELEALPQRWVLVDSSERVLSAVPQKLGDFAAATLQRRGVEIRLQTKLAGIDADSVTLSDGERNPAGTVVWAAGVTPNPLVKSFGLPTDERGRVLVDPFLRVEGREDVFALGDAACVPNAATPEKADPPTSQHAIRQAKRLVANMTGDPAPYRFRSLGQVATLGHDRGVAEVFGLKLRGRPAAAFARIVHVRQLPLRSRRARVLSDGLLSKVLERDMAQLGALESSLPSTVRLAAVERTGRLAA